MLSTAQHLWVGHMRGAKGASAADQEGTTWTSNCKDRGLARGHSEDPTEAARARDQPWRPEFSGAVFTSASRKLLFE